MRQNFVDGGECGWPAPFAPVTEILIDADDCAALYEFKGLTFGSG
jgi:hypothetical protein